MAIRNTKSLQRMLADLADSRAELAESFARFARSQGDFAAEERDNQEAARFHALAESHRQAAIKTPNRRRTKEQR